MKNKQMPIENKVVLYQEKGTNVIVDVLFDEETFWLTQKTIAELFDVDGTVITRHLSNYFCERRIN